LKKHSSKEGFMMTRQYRLPTSGNLKQRIRLGVVAVLLMGTSLALAVPLGRKPFSRSETIAQSGEWPNGLSTIQGRVFRRVFVSRLGHVKVRLVSQTGDMWTVGVNFGGHFSFQNLAPGLYRLSTTDTFGYHDVAYDPSQTGQDEPVFPLKSSQRLSQISLEMKPLRPYRHLSGRILDEQGKPVIGQTTLRVYAWVRQPHHPSKGHFQRLSHTKVNPDNGSYTLENLDGRDVLVQVVDTADHLRDEAFIPCFYPGTSSRGRAVKFGEKDMLTGMDIVLNQSEGVPLRGRVTNENGRGISEAQVSLFHADMLFDLCCTYTDENGSYQFTGLGAGDYIVHVDARHLGWIKTRRALTIESESTPNSLNFTLTRGITLRGRFIDEAGRPWSAGNANGSIRTRDTSGGGFASNFAYGNKYAPEHLRRASTLWSEQGQGDHPSDYMAYLTADTFIIPAVLSGELKLNVRAQGARLIKILYGDEEIDIVRGTMRTDSKQKVNDITLVVRPESKGR
jgi:hypothetical protein